MVGDELTQGPSNLITTDRDILLCVPHVTPGELNESVVNLYITEPTEKDKRTKPFTHMVGLKGEKGIMTNIRGLFDDGAMVNSLCKTAYSSMKDSLGNLLPSSRTLRMANGTCVPSAGRWIGNVHLGTQNVRSTFEVFPSGGGWSLLFGKPLLEQFKAVHDYGNDTIYLPKDNGERDTVVNSQSETPKHDAEKRTKSLQGEYTPPSRQVSLLNHTKSEQINKHNIPDVTVIPAKSETAPAEEQSCKKRRGRRSRLKERKNRTHVPQGPGFWDAVWTIGDSTITGNGDMQPEVEIDGNTSLFTRQTDPFKPKRVAEILRQIKIGSDVSAEEREQIIALVAEFADCFALSVREVLPIPGAEH